MVGSQVSIPRFQTWRPQQLPLEAATADPWDLLPIQVSQFQGSHPYSHLENV